MAKKNNSHPIPFSPADGGSIYSSESSIFDRAELALESNVLMLPLENEVFMPYLKVGYKISAEDGILLARKAFKDGEQVFFFLASDSLPQNLAETDDVDVYQREGCFGIITDLVDNPDGSINIVAEVNDQGSIAKLRRRAPYLRADIYRIFPMQIQDDRQAREMGKSLSELYMSVLVHISDDGRNQLLHTLNEMHPDSIRALNFMIQNSPLDPDERYFLLTSDTLDSRRIEFMNLLQEQAKKLHLRAEIYQRSMQEMGERQKEEFLRSQIRQMRNELGESDDDEIQELQDRADAIPMSEETRKCFSKELKRLTRYNPSSPEYAIQYSYLDTFLNLPWNRYDESDISLEKVREVLDRQHYGLDKVKERIVEQMAVLRLRGDMKAPILCLYGPPGVGKTSLGKSVAEALGRKYVRVALGGVHDEAEIRGHRRTYLGSMPGRIISSLEKCGSGNPVMVLDEIDKIGASIKGDPSTALLEVLDPEQNCRFHDNYLDHDYDLSKVLFIATANDLSTVSAPLLDRMELIEIEGYVEDEKVEIAKRHLIPDNLKRHGFASDEMTFTDDAIREIIRSYTRESGVRRLEKKIATVLRKQACLKASGKPFAEVVDINLVKEYLGPQEVFPDSYDNNDIPGIVTGLAWTQAGGEILFIESSVSPGKENRLTLTGNLGDVMKESAVIAMQYIRANADTIGIPAERLEVGTVHIHVPEGAVPKDGPSAGVTMVTSLASTFTGRKVRSHLAMTGEITLRGKVLPVGGIKEKILAAKRAGIKTVLLCEKNRKDVEEIKPEYVSGLDFHYVNTVNQVLEFALLP